VFPLSADRAFNLPGTGSPSLLFVFSGQQLGALAVSSDDRGFAPGTIHDHVRLTFWASEASDQVHPGDNFDIWYGGIVGHGSIESIEMERA
jgi:hypothetical protein